jgi:DNA-binding XRE family transcriptional regulator
MAENNVKKLREKLMLSKAELARRANVSPLTIDRIEKGENCRIETKRKILSAFGFEPTQKSKVFPGK